MHERVQLCQDPQKFALLRGSVGVTRINHNFRVHVHTFLNEDAAAKTIEEVGQKSLERLFPEDSTEQAAPRTTSLNRRAVESCLVCVTNLELMGCRSQLWTVRLTTARVQTMSSVPREVSSHRFHDGPLSMYACVFHCETQSFAPSSTHGWLTARQNSASIKSLGTAATVAPTPLQNGKPCETLTTRVVLRFLLYHKTTSELNFLIFSLPAYKIGNSKA